MGGGSWKSSDFVTYSCSLGRSVTSDGSVDLKGMSTGQVCKMTNISKNLDPLNKVRECRDSKEHPNTIPVILALDVTGSMGQAAVEVASQLNIIMTEIYKNVQDVEFLIMGIGDFDYDDSPLQVSQFESDIRIAKQLDELYFEFGGGPNRYESYTAAWCFALNNTKLDCWNRGKKGIIITMGDEEINPYIDGTAYRRIVGGQDSSTIETVPLYKKVIEKFDGYHINVERGTHTGTDDIRKSWTFVIGDENFISTEIQGISQHISRIVSEHDTEPTTSVGTMFSTSEPITW